ncbi:MAG: hypothetical protein ACPG8W_01680 [Candidatus Promineifilaceae bacterium]
MKVIYNWAIMLAVLIAGVAPALFFGNMTAREFNTPWQSNLAGITAGATYILTGALSGHAAVEFWRRKMWWPMVVATAFIALVVGIGYFNLEGIAQNLVLLEPVAYLLGGLFHVLHEQDEQSVRSAETTHADLLTKLDDAHAAVAHLTNRAESAERTVEEQRALIDRTLHERTEDAQRALPAPVHAQTDMHVHPPTVQRVLTVHSAENAQPEPQLQRTLKMDETHTAILKLLNAGECLKSDGTPNYSAIGKQIGVSRTTAQRRVMQLINAGEWGNE